MFISIEVTAGIGSLLFFPLIWDAWMANARTLGWNIFPKRFGFAFLKNGQPQNRKPKTSLE